jgi:hypothetical protein
MGVRIMADHTNLLVGEDLIGADKLPRDHGED